MSDFYQSDKFKGVYKSEIDSLMNAGKKESRVLFVAALIMWVVVCLLVVDQLTK